MATSSYPSRASSQQSSLLGAGSRSPFDQYDSQGCYLHWKRFGKPHQDELNGNKKTFRSYLRLLVELDVRNPLKPGFPFRRDGGESLLIFLKYERLDVYCVSCGRIGHNQSHYMAPPEERFLERYEISLKHNIFSNILPASPSTHPKPATTVFPSQLSQVPTLENELTHPSSAPKNHVPTQSNSTHLHPNQPHFSTSSTK
jgi:hypothetical protein